MFSLVLLPIVVLGELRVPQFSNPIYPELGYSGSRVLETNYSANAFVDLQWTQTVSAPFMVIPEQHVVVEVSSEGLGSVFAGQSGRAGFNDGSPTSALFNAPSGIASNENGVYVVDTGNFVVRQITAGTVSTVAGIPGQSGLRDGDGRKALFTNPTSIGIKGSQLFVLDSGIVRMITLLPTGGSVVQSLVDGACRGIETGTVRCQYLWASSTVETWVWPTFCLGNAVTCETRYDELYNI